MQNKLNVKINNDYITMMIIINNIILHNRDGGEFIRGVSEC